MSTNKKHTRKCILPTEIREKLRRKQIVLDQKSKEIEIKRTQKKKCLENFKDDNYIRNINKVKQLHLKLLRDLRIQKRSRGGQFTYLRNMKYFIFSSDNNHTQINKNGQKIKPSCNDSIYPLRLTFFNGGKAHFPYEIWDKVFDLRAKDILSQILLFDNEIAHSEEGFKLFFELDYRSKTESPCADTILKHVCLIIDMVRLYYIQAESFLDFSCWVLLSTPKPKYVNDEMHPIIAMGCHIVFRNIIVNCEQATQICHNINLEMESKYNLTDVVDIACYKRNIATLRPIYCRKLEVCLHCLNDDDMRLNCEHCLCRGKTPSGSIYTPSYLLDNEKKDVFSGIELERHIRENMASVMRDTSIIPCARRQFTIGYAIPTGHPLHIPTYLRSRHEADKSKNYVFQKDRHTIAKRRSLEIYDETIKKIICEIIKQYHYVYNVDTMLLSSLTKTQNGMIFVDLKGSGRSFCRILSSDGHQHKSNRIYFIICTKKGIITQYCYDSECRKTIKENPEIRERLTTIISAQNLKKIRSICFKQEPTTPQSSNKHENMLKFLS